MLSKLGFGFAVICVLALVSPGLAHHSASNYTDTYTNIEGVVKELHLVVPHSWVYMEVKDAKAEPQVWILEAIGWPTLQRIGVTPDYLKVGDPVKARCFPLRDGSHGCRLGFIKAKDRSVKNWNADDTPAPSDF